MDRPCALIVAHPGHELFVYGWVQRYKPLTFVLTDGSGRNGTPRIGYTRRLLESLDATPAPVFGRYADTELYRLIRERRTQVFVDLARELAASLVAHGVRTVVGDAFERQFLAHDVCRMLIGSAVEHATRMGGSTIRNHAFRLFGYAGRFPPSTKASFEIVLDEETLAAKLVAARSVPDPGVQKEIDTLIDRFGIAAYQKEQLVQVDNWSGFETVECVPPLYELGGEERVAEGYYPEVIRWREHVLPIAHALQHAMMDDRTTYEAART